MSTDLEKFLINKRQNLDVETPDDQLIWEGIRKDLNLPGLHSKRKRNLLRIRNIAAVAIILISLAYIANDIIVDRIINNNVSLAQIDRDLGAREKEYKNMISYKKKEIGSYNKIDNIVISELLEEIQKLDTIYENTMKDLGELGYNEKVINTIFDTYEKKIYLLELIILENNKIQNDENDENVFL